MLGAGKGGTPRRTARAVASSLLILALSVASSSLARASEEGARPSGDALQLAYLFDSAVTAEAAPVRATTSSGPAVTLADALADLAWRRGAAVSGWRNGNASRLWSC